MKIYSLLILFVLSSCITVNEGENIYEINGFVPVYGNVDDYRSIEYKAPQPMESAGRIFYFNQNLYVVEGGKGIHIIKNSNPDNPVKVGFLAVPGCQNVVVKGNHFYANNFSDLVVIDMSNYEAPTVVQRFENQIGNMNDFVSFPEEGYYLCPDDSRLVIGWEQGAFFSNQCYKIQ